MTSIHAKVLSTEKFRDQYRLIIELVPSEFLGPFERLRFMKNPYSGSFGTSLSKSWLTLDYRKDPGFKAGETFPLRGPIRIGKLGSRRVRKMHAAMKTESGMDQPEEPAPKTLKEIVHSKQKLWAPRFRSRKLATSCDPRR
jgi:hypothetical protein